MEQCSLRPAPASQLCYPPAYLPSCLHTVVCPLLMNKLLDPHFIDEEDGGHTHPNIATLGFISAKDDGCGPRLWATMMTADQALQVTGMVGKYQHPTVLESDHSRGSLLSLSENDFQGILCVEPGTLSLLYTLAPAPCSAFPHAQQGGDSLYLYLDTSR